MYHQWSFGETQLVWYAWCWAHIHESMCQLGWTTPFIIYGQKPMDKAYTLTKSLSSSYSLCWSTWLMSNTQEKQFLRRRRVCMLIVDKNNGLSKPVNLPFTKVYLTNLIICSNNSGNCLSSSVVWVVIQIPIIRLQDFMLRRFSSSLGQRKAQDLAMDFGMGWWANTFLLVKKWWGIQLLGAKTQI